MGYVYVYMQYMYICATLHLLKVCSKFSSVGLQQKQLWNFSSAIRESNASRRVIWAKFRTPLKSIGPTCPRCSRGFKDARNQAPMMPRDPRKAARQIVEEIPHEFLLICLVNSLDWISETRKQSLKLTEKGKYVSILIIIIYFNNIWLFCY